MRRSEFNRAVAEEFGEQYASVLIRDHWLQALGSTAEEAINSGSSLVSVWNAICVDFEVPEHRRHGRGLIEAKKFQ